MSGEITIILSGENNGENTFVLLGTRLLILGLIVMNDFSWDYTLATNSNTLQLRLVIMIESQMPQRNSIE